MNRVGGSNRIGIDPTESNGDSGKMDVIVLDDNDSCDGVNPPGYATTLGAYEEVCLFGGMFICCLIFVCNRDISCLIIPLY